VVAYAIIDAVDAAWIGQWRWCLAPSGYAVRRDPNGGTLRMNRELLGLIKGDKSEGDHVNRDRLDNRRANLRVATKAENRQNRTPFQGGTSRYRGVWRHPDTGHCQAYVSVNRKKIYLGYFKSEEEAAEVARAARAKMLPYATD
jgi:hypothetical protein